ncbi:uncharacterized protein LOC110981556 [Acanthaster planci]|uniref:RING-type E3 ubiquitin transferase n=1 Tax=Acanthaster planci TaxID=133434 RepID=A0A8B7YQC1_ACAPL|nr:uncharacterized protein LOC110981556 [Acanthaster planci]
MPIQAPQWTEFLSCPVCYNEFDENVRRPISLGCGHTVCKMCLGKFHRKQCPFDQTEITRDIDELPANYALLQLVGAELGGEHEERLPRSIVNGYLRHYAAAKSCVEDLAWYLKPLGKAASASSASGSGGCILSKPMQRKLVALVNCQLVEDEGRSRAMRAARSLGERAVTELILQHQNQQQLSANLWAAVRSRGCQFLGPAMQEETLKLVLLALEDGAALSRKVLVMFVVQKLEQQFPQASKTSVGHVVQLLYRASCFIVTKRDEESSLMQLKDEFRNYDALRREHDAQIVHIAMEAGLRISPEQWSSLLYGDLNHKSHMQSIIDKLQTPASFTASIQELTIALQRSGDPGRLSKLTTYLDQLATIDPNPDAGSPSWSELENAMVAVKTVVKGLVDFVQNHNLNKKVLEQQTQNIKYKTSMCRDITQKRGCPRGSNCTFAHSEEELERFRAKSRRMLSALNRQISSQSKASEGAKTTKLISKGVSEDRLTKEDRHNLMELQQQVALQNKRDKVDQLSQSNMQAVSGNLMSAYRDYRDEMSELIESSTDVERHPNDGEGRHNVDGQNASKFAPHCLVGKPEHHPVKQLASAASHAEQAHLNIHSKRQVSPAKPSGISDVYKEQGKSLDEQAKSNIQISMSEMYVHPPGARTHLHSAPQPVYSYHYSNNVTAHTGEVEPPGLIQSIDSHKTLKKDSTSSWDMPDGPPQELPGYSQGLVKRTVGAGKPTIKSPVANTWNSNSNKLHKDISLGELCERKQEILHQLKGFSSEESKNPWERSQSLTKTVTSLWTIPTESVSKQTSHTSQENEVCYNPWTSQAPFCLVRPVKESNTNYTMTYIKAHIRHMSVDEHQSMVRDKPMGTHELSEFKKMSMEDLEQTLKKVKQEDEHAGSSHYERGHKIQLEMDRRVQQNNVAWGIPTGESADSKNKQAQLHPSTLSGGQRNLMAYYQALSLGPHQDPLMSRQGSFPMSKSSRTAFKSTGPVQVSAGPSPETNPVTLTQDCHVAPSFQSSPSEGYHILGQPSKDSRYAVSLSLKTPPQVSESKLPQQGQRETDIEMQLKNELADVSNEIQKKVLNKNAQDIVLLEQASHALDPLAFISGSRNPVSVYEPLSNAMIAKQLQQQELDKYKFHHKREKARASSVKTSHQSME